MEERDLLRLAVRRKRITEDQLREAEGYAQGGRSVLSVLLDLGHLSLGDIVDLALIQREPSARVPVGCLLVAVLLAGLAGLGLSLMFSESEPPPLPPKVRPPSVSYPVIRPDAKRTLSERGFNLVWAVTNRHKRSGKLTPADEANLRRGIILIEEAVRLGYDQPLAYSTMGKAWELLDDSPMALAAYAKCVSMSPDSRGSLMGAARICLKTDRPAEALTYIDLAMEVTSNPFGDQYLLRARARLALGRRKGALEDLEFTRTRWPAFSTEIDKILEENPE